MQTTTVQFDAQSQQELDRLARVFAASGNAAVIRKALALAALVADEAGDSREVIITGTAGRPPVRLSLAT